jgi:hypothetical protein
MAAVAARHRLHGVSEQEFPAVKCRCRLLFVALRRRAEIVVRCGVDFSSTIRCDRRYTKDIGYGAAAEFLFRKT